MNYIDFLKNLERLYKKFFNEEGVHSNLKISKAEEMGYVNDHVIIKLPKELKGRFSFNVKTDKEDFERDDFHAKIIVDGIADVSEIDSMNNDRIYFKFKGKKNPAIVYEEINDIFQDMLKLIQSNRLKKLKEIQNMNDDMIYWKKFRKYH